MNSHTLSLQSEKLKVVSLFCVSFSYDFIEHTTAQLIRFMITAVPPKTVPIIMKAGHRGRKGGAGD